MGLQDSVTQFTVTMLEHHFFVFVLQMFWSVIRRHQQLQQHVPICGRCSQVGASLACCTVSALLLYSFTQEPSGSVVVLANSCFSQAVALEAFVTGYCARSLSRSGPLVDDDPRLRQTCCQLSNRPHLRQHQRVRCCLQHEGRHSARDVRRSAVRVLEAGSSHCGGVPAHVSGHLLVVWPRVPKRSFA